MHMMNPQRAAHMGLQQIQTPAPDESGADMTKPQEGVGSAQAGYAGPENGPFECENCIHFDGQGSCDHPQVVTDPEVQGKVDAEGCCNFFSPSGNETQEEEHNEGSAVDEEAPGAVAG